jgi:hypothetical protein
MDKLELDAEKGPIWEQQEGEPPKAYMLFCLYRDFGPHRTLAKVFAKYNGVEFNYTQPTGLHMYSAPGRWIERAQAFDAHILEEEGKENERLIKKFNKERMEQALELMDASFEQMLIDIEDPNLPPREKRERYKLGFDMFRTINNLDKDSKIEHSGTVKIVFGDELKDV